MDGGRKRALAREIAETLAFLLVTVVLMYFVMHGTELTTSEWAGPVWVALGLGLGVLALLSWLYSLPPARTRRLRRIIRQRSRQV